MSCGSADGVFERLRWNDRSDWPRQEDSLARGMEYCLRCIAMALSQSYTIPWSFHSWRYLQTAVERIELRAVCCSVMLILITSDIEATTLGDTYRK